MKVDSINENARGTPATRVPVKLMRPTRIHPYGGCVYVFRTYWGKGAETESILLKMPIDKILSVFHKNFVKMNN